MSMVGFNVANHSHGGYHFIGRCLVGGLSVKPLRISSLIRLKIRLIGIGNLKIFKWHVSRFLFLFSFVLKQGVRKMSRENEWWLWNSIMRKGVVVYGDLFLWIGWCGF